MFEGERVVASRNKLLGTYVLEGVPPGPAGQALDTALALDEDGILTVNARVAKEVTQRVAPRVVQGVAQRVALGVAQGVAQRVTQKVAPRVVQGVAQKVAQGVAPRLAQVVDQRVPQGVAQRVSQGVAQGLASEEPWKGCSMKVQERRVAEVVAHLEDAEKFKDQDQQELERLRAFGCFEEYVWSILTDEKARRGQWGKMGTRRAMWHSKAY